MKDMTDLILTKTRMRQGVWEGLITGSDAEPKVSVSHLDQPIGDVEITQVDAGWLLQFPIPADAVADGVHTLVMTDEATGCALGHETLIAGEVMGDDIRAEMNLLRAELDMLKRAFRRHCVETS